MNVVFAGLAEWRHERCVLQGGGRHERCVLQAGEACMLCFAGRGGMNVVFCRAGEA